MWAVQDVTQIALGGGIGIVGAALIGFGGRGLWRMATRQTRDLVKGVTKGDIDALASKIDGAVSRLTTKIDESIATNSAEHAQFGGLFRDHEARLHALETRQVTTTVTVDHKEQP